MRLAIRPSPFLVIFTVGAKLNVMPSIGCRSSIISW